LGNAAYPDHLVTALATSVVALTGARIALGSVIGFIVWILVMAWIYNIAKRKGRHAFLWLVFGFFFSIIALIIVALLPSKRTTQAYQRG
jgi:uncharacterized membrane protein YdjX (TVP38/TMEM64 family)